MLGISHWLNKHSHNIVRYLITTLFIRQSHIRSFTAHDIYSLQGEVPETLVSGETPDISEFASFQWYEWVKFRDQQVSFPHNNFVLGRYLGPSFGIGPAMTAKILKKNAEYVHRSTYRSLTDDELNDPWRLLRDSNLISP